MDQQNNRSEQISDHPLMVPLQRNFEQFGMYAYSDAQNGWDDDHKRAFYEQSLKEYSSAHIDYLNETERLLYILEEAEKIAKSYLDATSGMGTSICGMKFISINEVRAVASNTVSRWLGRGW